MWSAFPGSRPVETRFRSHESFLNDVTADRCAHLETQKQPIVTRQKKRFSSWSSPSAKVDLTRISLNISAHYCSFAQVFPTYYLLLYVFQCKAHCNELLCYKKKNNRSLCIGEDRQERKRDCLCGGKRRCDSPLTRLITDGEDSVELCRKFLLPQCCVCLMLSPLYYSPQHPGQHTHTEQERERECKCVREREKEQQPPCYLYLFNSLLQMSYSCLQTMRDPAWPITFLL